MFREAFINNVSTTTLAAGTGIAFTPIPLKMSSNFDFCFKRTIHTATDDRIYKKIFDNRTSRYLYKSYDDLRAISGKSLSGITTLGFLPFNWPVPYTANKNADITIHLSDFSGAPNTIDLSYHGDAVYESAPLDMYGNPVDYEKDKKGLMKCSHITYESASIAADAGVGKQKQGLIVIDDDADFVCNKITGVVTAAGYVTIEDTTRARTWQNQKTATGNLFGNGQFPNVLTSPIFIKRNSRILVTFENNDAGANTLVLYLSGYKRS